MTQPPDSKPPVAFVERPWGYFKQFAHNEPVTVSLMCVQPGQRLSLQAHTLRAELWIVLDDGAVIEINGTVHHGKAGDEFWISANSAHRLSNSLSTGEVRVLEVAFGNWQQEDITRYADDYARPTQGE